MLQNIVGKPKEGLCFRLFMKEVIFWLQRKPNRKLFNVRIDRCSPLFGSTIIDHQFAIFIILIMTLNKQIIFFASHQNLENSRGLKHLPIRIFMLPSHRQHRPHQQWSCISAPQNLRVFYSLFKPPFFETSPKDSWRLAKCRKFQREPSAIEPG